MLGFVQVKELNQDIINNMAERYVDHTRGVNPESPAQGKYVDLSRHPVIHPDMQDAYLNYQGPKSNSFQKVFNERKRKKEAGEKYHNDEWDEQLTETARNRSKSPDFKWPKKRGEATYEEELTGFRTRIKAIWSK